MARAPAKCLTNPCQQLAGREFQSASHFDDIDQANVPFASLDSADVGPVQISSLCESFLRQSELEPALPHGFSEKDSWVVLHGLDNPRLMTMSLETISIDTDAGRAYVCFPL